ncbi:MAG: lptB 3, partial [Acidimicrobiia bacterium]|nr:lptB 3 [Acidimicrobiia bacterium]
DHGYSIGVSLAIGILAAIVVSLAFQFLILRRLTKAAPITRLISTLGLLAVAQAAVQLKYGNANKPVSPYLPHNIYDWGGVQVQEQRLIVIGVAIVITAVLWAFTRYTRVGLAITAAAQNERAAQTLGWSPNLLSALTWGIGAAVAGLAGVLVAPFTGLSTSGFTLVVTVAALAAALLGGFRSFPMTFVGGLVVGIGESLVTLYRGNIEDFFHQDQITGLNRAVPFLVILLVLVVRGRGLPLRSHVTDRLPRLGTGRINVKALVLASAILLVLLFTVFDDRWASAMYVSMSSAIIVLSVVVLTGYAGQLSLGQWAVGGIGAMIAALLIARLDWPLELAVPAGILLTIPAGMLFALPALRTRGVNLAVVTLGLGFTVSEVVFANTDWIGTGIDGGTRVGDPKLFGFKIDAATHPHRYATVCLVAFVLVGLMVANLRRSRTGRRLIAVRTNERAAASLGVSVFAVKIYAFAVAAAIAAVAGILVGFQAPVVTYGSFNVFASINAVGYAVIGGIGFVIGAAFSAPNAIGGFGTRIFEDLLSVGRWDDIIGGVLLLIIIVANQDGVAAVATEHLKPLLRKIRLSTSEPKADVLTEVVAEPVPPVTLEVSNLTVRFGSVLAVNEVAFKVSPGEVVGLIGPNGAGKTTIIDAVTGFVRPASAHIKLNDEAIETWGASKRAVHGLRRSFQSLELFEDVTVQDNIRAGADSGRPISWFTDLFWPGKHQLPSTAVSAIHQFELVDSLNQLPEQLSYGRRRLVSIARAVASGPSIVMLDEPAAGLDETESRELARLIRSLADDRKMGVLLVEHDVGMVMSTCDRIVVIDFGRVIASGTPEEIRNNHLVREAYLGSSTTEPESVEDRDSLMAAES